MVDLSTNKALKVAVLRIQDEEYALDANKDIVAGFLYAMYGNAKCPNGKLLFEEVSEWCENAEIGKMFVTNGLSVKIRDKF